MRSVRAHEFSHTPLLTGLLRPTYYFANTATCQVRRYSEDVMLLLCMDAR